PAQGSGALALRRDGEEGPRRDGAYLTLLRTAIDADAFQMICESVQEISDQTDRRAPVAKTGFLTAKTASQPISLVQKPGF
ncbi:hypothetical protein, partial [Tychonema sp. LEGE 07203]|uniref:hypothetical protein n=1 Tax=Tychonema sp. LEGE 07203 TaxID=1828671 RepID=UPI001D1374E4